MWTTVKIIVLVLIVVFVAWIGLTCYSNFIAKPDTGQPDIPGQDSAAYSVYIENSGNLLLTDDYEAHGVKVGNRVFILHHFWELRGQEFVYKEGDIILDEAIFGEITIKRR